MNNMTKEQADYQTVPDSALMPSDSIFDNQSNHRGIMSRRSSILTEGAILFGNTGVQDMFRSYARDSITVQLYAQKSWDLSLALAKEVGVWHPGLDGTTFADYQLWILDIVVRAQRSTGSVESLWGPDWASFQSSPTQLPQIVPQQVKPRIGKTIHKTRLSPDGQIMHWYLDKALCIMLEALAAILVVIGAAMTISGVSAAIAAAAPSAGLVIAPALLLALAGVIVGVGAGYCLAKIWWHDECNGVFINVPTKVNPTGSTTITTAPE